MVLSIAENQTLICQELHNFGYIEILGEMDLVVEGDITSAIKKCLSDPAALVAQSDRGRHLVPAYDARKCSDVLIDLSQHNAYSPSN